jgi:diacylglycerol kinase (ATP)
MRLFSATKNSLRGIVDGIRTEAAVREEAIAFVLAVPIGIFVAPNLAWYVAMIAALLVLLAIEFLNTAIENRFFEDLVRFPDHS